MEHLKKKGGAVMSTKGASNHYGNSRGGKQGKATNHTGYAWAKDFNKSTLADNKAKAVSG